jgi:hypothetical protein
VGLKDVTGVFGREFIVGYFAPAFFIGIVVAYSLDWTPELFERAGASSRLLILGGVALLVALILNGVRQPVASIYSGTRPIDVIGLGTASIEFAENHARPRRRIASWATRRLQHQFDALEAVIANGGSDARAARQIRDARLGSERDEIAPTRLGAARGAVSGYVRSRWSADFWYVWPRVEPLLDDAELALRRDAETDQAFFLNGALLTLLAGAALTVDELAGDTTWWRLVLIPAVAVLMHWMLYRFAVQAAERAATYARASIDRHYPELLSRLGASGDLAVASAELDRFWFEGTRPAWLATLPPSAGDAD